MSKTTRTPEEQARYDETTRRLLARIEYHRARDERRSRRRNLLRLRFLRRA